MPVVAAMAPEYMTEGLDETPSGTIDFSAVDRVLDLKADVIAVGPGLGTGARNGGVRARATSSAPACRSCSTRMR